MSGFDTDVGGLHKATDSAVVGGGRGAKGDTGAAGADAYDIAVAGGYRGTKAEWIASLKGATGDSAYDVAVEGGFNGTKAEWLASLVGPRGRSGLDGESAYDVALSAGYQGTQQEWYASLKGADGRDAYDIAVAGGYKGTKVQWLASLKGSDGLDGADGDSAYDIAVINGYKGTRAEWLASLKGATGDAGQDADFSTLGRDTVDGSVLKDGTVGTTKLSHNLQQQHKRFDTDITKLEDVTVDDNTVDRKLIDLHGKGDDNSYKLATVNYVNAKASGGGAESIYAINGDDIESEAYKSILARQTAGISIFKFNNVNYFSASEVGDNLVLVSQYFRGRSHMYRQRLSIAKAGVGKVKDVAIEEVDFVELLGWALLAEYQGAGNWTVLHVDSEYFTSNPIDYQIGAAEDTLTYHFNLEHGLQGGRYEEELALVTGNDVNARISYTDCVSSGCSYALYGTRATARDWKNNQDGLVIDSYDLRYPGRFRTSYTVQGKSVLVEANITRFPNSHNVPAGFSRWYTVDSVVYLTNSINPNDEVFQYSMRKTIEKSNRAIDLQAGSFIYFRSVVGEFALTHLGHKGSK